MVNDKTLLLDVVLTVNLKLAVQSLKIRKRISRHNMAHFLQSDT